MKLIIKKDELNKLRLAMAFMAKEDVRYYLNGIFLKIEEEKEDGSSRVRIVATDGHRLAADILEIWPDDLAKPGWWTDLEAEKAEIIVGFSKNEKLPRSCDWVEIELPSRSAPGTLTCYKNGKGVQKVISINVVDGTYPDWRRIIPKEYGTTEVRSMGIHPQYLTDIVTSLVGLRYHNVKIEFSEGGNASSYVVTVSEHSGPDTSILIMPVTV